MMVPIKKTTKLNKTNTKTSSKCVNTSEVIVNPHTDIEKRIYLDYSMQILDPPNTPLKRNPNENEINVLIVPDKGDQTLVIFTLPKDVNGTVQDIVTRLAKICIGKIVKIFLVTDPFHNVRYVLQTFPDDNSLDQLQRITHAANGLSHSHDGHCANGPEHESTQEPQLHVKRNLQILVSYPPPPSNGSITITTDDLKCLEDDVYINDTIIDFYLKYLILETLSLKDQKRIHLFSSFFYMTLTNTQRTSINGSHLSTLTENGEIQHANVKRWTKHVNIFEKDFIIIPIHENDHWFLTIICYPNMIANELNESLLKPTKQNCKPSILIFESMSSLTFKRWMVAKLLKNYIQIEYKAKFGRECALSANDVDVIYPVVPRQHNNSDCGLYLLQYAENFFKDYITDCEFQVPLILSLKNWFDADAIEKKRDQLKKLIIKLANDSQLFKKPRLN